VGRYHVRDKLSQGYREWIDARAYVEQHGVRDCVSQRRIATQRITGVDEKLRVVATFVDPPAYFADSTNSIQVDTAGGYSYEYILAIVNSALIQWRFRLTSTNNNVGTNELESLPLRLIDFELPADSAMHSEITSLVRDLIAGKADAGDGTDEISVRKLTAIDRRIDAIVLDLYGVGNAYQMLIERDRSKRGAGVEAKVLSEIG
ncbi:MAG: hypothetical protein ACK8QZ_05235, partial [Anaerolineales bacterium]